MAGCCEAGRAAAGNAGIDQESGFNYGAGKQLASLRVGAGRGGASCDIAAPTADRGLAVLARLRLPLHFRVIPTLLRERESRRKDAAGQRGPA